MTYQVLARKWRPRSFREMAGQGHVLKTLINSLDNNRLHHAYLFTGTRGVGKTTIARILAKCLNCEAGVSAEPCGQCSACQEIDQGRFIDLIEVDAASRTKVEDTRELLDNVQYSPTRGRYKVYLIDEVHMLSGHSFNALLKTLEEPPPHVKFLLATTDPQKLPVTILSRCLQFNLKNLSPEQLVQHLSHILAQEEIPFEEPALWQLARAAGGSVRDSLTLLDQAIAFCDGNLLDTEVSALLGSIDQSIIHAVVDALAAADARMLLQVVDGAAAHAPDFTAVLEDLMSYLHRIAIAQVLPDAIDNSQGDRKQVLAHAAELPAENVQLYYQIGLRGREELPLAVDARAGLEMTLLRMLAFTPEGVPAVPAATLPGHDAQAADMGGDELKKKPEAGPLRSSPSAPASLPQSQSDLAQSDLAVEAPARSSRSLPERSLSGATVAAMAEPARVPVVTAEVPEFEPEQQAVLATPELPASANDEALHEESRLALEGLQTEDWIRLFLKLPLSGITRNIASHCVLTDIDGDRLSLLLHEAQASVFNEEHQRRIEEALGGYFGRRVHLDISLGSIDARHGETPAAWRRRRLAERQQAALDAFTNDRNVQEILERFSGTILTDTVEPVQAGKQ